MNIDRRAWIALVALAGLGFGRGASPAQEGATKDANTDGVVTLTAVVKAKAGQEEAVKEALLGLVEPTRREPGCLHYILHQSQADPTEFLFYEQWTDQKALDAHGKTDHMKALGAKLRDKTDRGGGVTRYDLLK